MEVRSMSRKPLPIPVKRSGRAVKQPRPVYLAESPPRPRILQFAPQIQNGYLSWKRTGDFIGALVLLVLAAPILLLLGLLVKWTSPGPALYTQRRLGRAGRPFTIFKLRTMQHKCESLTGPRWSVPGDPRVTPLGRFLRKTHLDELPQLLNVLRGDMSLVGPRPERPEFLPELEAVFPRYRERLAVRPGITGLAQVQLPPDTDLTDVSHKLACDIHYAQHVALSLDLRLLGCTALYALGVPFRWSARLLHVPTTGNLEQEFQEPLIVFATRQRKIA
jgi:lipopolysaccharide/colanic/teichoic acid biosynthesis glycosyltransferase